MHPRADDILRIARSYLGTPFQHQGRLRGVGIDCLGLVLETLREAGLLPRLGLPPDWDCRDYSREPEGARLSLALTRYLTPLPRTALRVGTIACFTLGPHPAHLGFLADGAQPFSLIHSFAAQVNSRARVLEHRLAHAWLVRLHSVYAVPLEDTPWPG